MTQAGMCAEALKIPRSGARPMIESRRPVLVEASFR